jgi:hypothetical protein
MDMGTSVLSFRLPRTRDNQVMNKMKKLQQNSKTGSLAEKARRHGNLRFANASVIGLLAFTAILLNAAPSNAQAASIHSHSPATPTGPETQLAYTKLKTLVGNWEGPASTTPEQDLVRGRTAQLSIRATSTGNAIMHDLTIGGLKDNPLTMFYVNEKQFLLTHYCDAGNRPRMIGAMSKDGRTLEFDFIDITGPLEYGHMHHAKFTFIDDDNHIEEWTYMAPGDKPIVARFDLRRKK